MLLQTDRCEDTRRQVVGRQTNVRPLTPSIPAGLPIRFGRSWKAARRWPADWTSSRLPAVSRLRWSACRAALRRRRSGFAPVAPPAQSRRRAVLRPSGGPLALRSRRDLRHRARLVRRSGRPGHRCRARRDRRCSIIVAAWGDDAALLEALFWDRSWIVGRRLERLAGRQLQCIGHTEDGCPASPSQLLVNYQKLQPFTVEHFTYPPGLRGTPRAPDRPRPIA